MPILPILPFSNFANFPNFANFTNFVELAYVAYFANLSNLSNLSNFVDSVNLPNLVNRICTGLFLQPMTTGGGWIPPPLKNKVNHGFFWVFFLQVENYVITSTSTKYLFHKLKFEAKAAV